MRKGQGRTYPPIAGIDSEVDYLIELHARAADLVSDLPERVLNKELYGHSIRKLMDHMIQVEIDWISQVTGIRSHFPLSDTKAFNQFTRNALREFDLETHVSAEPFACVGQVLRHVQWHWTYHSAQIGLLRKAFSHRYKWTFK